MKYITYFKNTLKVNGIFDKEPIAITNNLALARCGTIPQGDKFTVANLQDKTERYTVKEPKEIVKVDGQGIEYTETEYIEVEKERIYQTCELQAIQPTTNELEERQAKEYEKLVERLIRQKYSLSNELAILRQATTKPEEFAEYNAYAEQCKEKAKSIIWRK